MVKPLLVLALVAYMVFISPTEGSSYRSASASAYFRGSNASPCYPTKKPKCTKPNEVYVENPSTCPPQTCKSINKIYHCPLARANTNTGNSNGACKCKPGYYRNSINECISKENCLKCTGPHEYFSCGVACDRTCKTLSKQYQTTCRIATFGCVPKCYCEPGYARDDKNICIPIKYCGGFCRGDPNAVPGCGENCGRRCSDIGKEKMVCPAICNPNGCDCKPGYVFDGNKGRCVQPKECSHTCGINEVFSNCTNGGCGPKTCDGLGTKIGCVKMDQMYCKEGCLCKSEYLRNEDGVCIPKTQCPECGGDPNAISGCGVNCGQHCSDIGQGPKPCVKICYNDACDCRKGFFYDNNIGKCVRPEDCTPTCGQNEIFSTCINGGCTAKHCSQIGRPVPCVKPKICHSGCLCKDGYLRADNGICIPKNECPNPECADDETYDTCPENSCAPQTCSQLGFPLNCTVNSESDCPGEPGCICANENVRDNEGNCIPKEQCPSCGGDPNAVSGCSNYCGKRCSDYKSKNKFCALFCLLNGCACRDGFVYDDNLKKCVNPRDCTPTCGVNEVFDTCTNGGCRKWNCSSEILCIDPFICKAGCSCQDGYSRAANGTCIPQDQCPVNCTGPNEYFACGGACDNVCETLSERNQTNCPIRNIKCNPMCYCREGYARDKNNICIPIKSCPVNCTGPNEYFACGGACDNVCETLSERNQTNCPILNIKCNPMCYCREGYARDKNNICIPIKSCPAPTCGQNEIFSTCINGGCTAKNCSQLGRPVPCVKPKTYHSGCLCKDGYLRADNGICIPKNECPNKNFYYYLANSCGPNERYEERPSLVCDPLECSELGFPINCPPVEDTDCDDEPGCICVDGYVRNHLGICVLKSQCPSCGGDPNAVAGCGVNCGKTCSTYGKDVACIEICYSNACDCKDGFVYDDVVKKCVKYENCSKSSSNCNANNTDLKNRHYRGSIALSGEFIYQLCQSQPDQNFVTSATSIMVPLAQIAFFAQNTVLKQLLTLLNLNRKDEIKCVYSEETQSYTNQKQVDFEITTKYYINKDYTLDPNFISVSQKYFGAGGENINFGNTEQAADTINEWVADKTRNRIQDLVSADSLDANTVMVLVNAIYFLGNWVHQFNPNNTQKRDFTKRNNDIIQLDTMYQENTFKYAETSLQGIDIQALEMPYKNNNFSFLVILPELGCFDRAVLALRNPENFIDIIELLSLKKVQVYLPKLNIATTIDETEMLKKVNLTAMFNPASDGFKGILKNDQPLYISSAVQKAFVKVDELGTEAAAATAIAIGLTAVLEPPQVFVFNANRPYLFYILFNGAPLFCGAYMAITMSRSAAVMQPPRVVIFKANCPFFFYIMYERTPMFSGTFLGVE